MSTRILTVWYSHRDRVLHAMVLGALAVLVAWPFVVDLVTDNPNFWVGVAGTTIISIILVISLNLAMGFGGLLSIVHTGMLAFGGYVSAILVTDLGMNFWIGALAAIALTTVFGVIVTAVSLRATYLYFGMITLAFNLLVVEVARNWESMTGGYFGLVGIPRPSVFGSVLSRPQMYWFILACGILAYVYQRNLVISRAGRAFQAVRESEDAAAALGIRGARTKLLAFGLASALAGLAGALFAHWNTFINPDVGLLDNALVLFIGLLLGGMSTLVGPILGVAVWTAIEQTIRGIAEYRRLVLGLVLLVALVTVPRGIVGQWKSSRFGKDLDDFDDEDPGAGPTTDDTEDTTRLSQLGALQPDRVVLEEGEDVIVARGIVKRFDGVTALAGVDLTVKGQEVHGIIGPNGSGKSTLVNCITAYLSRDAGEVELLGAEAPSKSFEVAENGVIRVFQTPHLFERVSVLDNVLVGMHMRSRQNWAEALLRLPSYGRDESGIRQDARRLLEVAGLSRLANRSAGSLSHGQKRLLEVVRALAAQPKVLILDEPATGLTSEEVETLHKVIRELRELGLTIALIEHNMSFVMRTCDRITVLENGHVIAVGSPDDVQSSEKVQQAYLGVSA